MKDDAIQLVLLVGAGLAIYYFLKKSPLLTTPASWIADFYLWATLPAAMVLQGNIVMPDGSLVPLASATVKQNASGDVVALYGGHYYQLFPSDENGNWPSVLVQ